MSPVKHGIDRVVVDFDDESLVRDTGLLLVAALAARLSLEGPPGRHGPARRRAGGARPGRKVLTVVHAMLAGGDCSTRPPGCAPPHPPPLRPFPANGASLQYAVLAHNLPRWATALGEPAADQLTVAKTFRTRLLAIPGRLVNHSGTPTLRLTARHPGTPRTPRWIQDQIFRRLAERPPGARVPVLPSRRPTDVTRAKCDARHVP